MSFVPKQKTLFHFKSLRLKLWLMYIFGFSKNVRRRVWRQWEKCEDLGDKWVSSFSMYNFYLHSYDAGCTVNNTYTIVSFRIHRTKTLCIVLASMNLIINCITLIIFILKHFYVLEYFISITYRQSMDALLLRGWIH